MSRLKVPLDLFMNPFFVTGLGPSVVKNAQNKKAVRRNPTAQNKKAVGSTLSAHGLNQSNLLISFPAGRPRHNNTKSNTRR